MKPALKTTIVVVTVLVAASGAYLWYSDTAFSAIKGRVASVFGGQNTRPERPPPAVVLAEVGVATVSRVVEAVGNTTAAESVTLTAEQPGRVVEIAFADGQTVNKGEVLVRLDRDIAVAELRNVEAEAQQVEQELGRADYLLSRGSGPKAVVEDTQRRLQAARAKVESARERLNDTELRAPFAGRVGLRDISVGATVERSTALAIIDAISPMDLRFSVPEQYLAQMKAGTKVRASTAAFPGRAFEGEVRAIASRVDPAQRTIAVEARLANDDGSLLPGMLMNVSATLETVENAVVIPPMALLVRGSQQFVYVPGENDTVVRREVRSGQREPERVQIAEGLKSGDRIVVEGVQNVTDGQKVRVVDPKAPQGRAADGDKRSQQGGG